MRVRSSLLMCSMLTDGSGQIDPFIWSDPSDRVNGRHIGLYKGGFIELDEHIGLKTFTLVS
jgi:hypothetical protein